MNRTQKRNFHKRDRQAAREGKAIEVLGKLRPKVVGVSHKSMIWNTAARNGQLNQKLIEIAFDKHVS